MTSANSFTGIGTADYKRAKNIIKELNTTAKKANNGMSFYIKEVSVDDNDEIERATEWFKHLL